MLAALALGACDEDEPQPGAGGRQPNIVVVMTDDQRADELAAMPRVNALLARHGAVFPHAFASFPLCCPSRATFLTGQYAHNHGVRDNRAEAGGGFEALDDEETLPVWLGRAGYSTAHVGKYLNGYRGPEAPPGWDEWHATIDPTTYRSYGFAASRNGRAVEPPGHQSDWVTREAVRLAGSLGGPFFLSVNYLAPHEDRALERGRCRESARPAPRHLGRVPVAGFRPPPSFDERDVSDKPPFIRAQPRLTPALRRAQARAWACRRESLLAVDEGVGAIVRGLRERGVLRDTLIIFTSDNGYFLGEHRLPDNKINVYEEAVRVPLVLRGPGVRRGRREEPASNVDLAPTLLEAAGAEAEVEQDGVSLLGDGPPRNRVLLLENLAAGEPRFMRYSALRLPKLGLLYVEYESGDRELYHLGSDPHQLRSLHRSREVAPLLRGFGRRLDRLRVCAGASCR